MSSARYYPQSFGSATIERADVRPHQTTLQKTTLMIAGVAIVSALAVFFALCERDYSLLLSVSSHRVRQPAAVQVAPVVSAEAQPAADSVTRVTVPTAETSASGPAADSPVTPAASDATVAHAVRRPVEFTLARSKRFQQVGAMWVGIWKIDAKHKVCDVSVVAGGHRVDRKHVSVNSPIAIASSGSSRPMQLVVNSMNRGSVSGYLSETRSVSK